MGSRRVTMPWAHSDRRRTLVLRAAAWFVLPVLLLAPAPSRGDGRGTSSPDRQHWAFRPPTRPTVLAVKHTGRVRTPIDAFLLARLEARGLTFSPDADRTTLLRRA